LFQDLLGLIIAAQAVTERTLAGQGLAEKARLLRYLAPSICRQSKKEQSPP